MLMFFFYRYGDHRYLHFLTHSFPTRRSSDLPSIRQDRRQKQHPSASPLPACPDASTSSNVLTDSIARADGRSILQPGEHPSACGPCSTSLAWTPSPSTIRDRMWQQHYATILQTKRASILRSTAFPLPQTPPPKISQRNL